MYVCCEVLGGWRMVFGVVVLMMRKGERDVRMK